MPDNSLQALRIRAVAIAYRMLGSRTEAEDIAQDTMVRVERALATEDVRSPQAFTTTVAARLSIDHLRSARAQREQYVGPWLPEPITGVESDDLATTAALNDSLSFAMLVVLESLGPVERAAFLLHDTFGYGYDELAEILDRSETACRQIVVRARQRVAAGRPRFTTDPQQHQVLLDRFINAARQGDMGALVELLAPDASLVSDGGANRRATRRPVLGRDRVARFLRTVGPQVFVADRQIEPTLVNGHPGFTVLSDGVTVLVGVLEGTDGQIHSIRWVVNPDKLTWMSRD
jgi:RNA polymerase sigma-70 factor (ECF subfamily)